MAQQGVPMPGALNFRLWWGDGRRTKGAEDAMGLKFTAAWLRRGNGALPLCVLGECMAQASGQGTLGLCWDSRKQLGAGGGGESRGATLRRCYELPHSHRHQAKSSGKAPPRF